MDYATLLHPNQKLRGKSTLSGISIADIGRMDEMEYRQFRAGVRALSRRLGNTEASRKQLNETLRKISIARKRFLRPRVANNFEKKESVILDALYPKRQHAKRWIQPHRRKGPVKEVNLARFSLMDAPEETLAALCSIAEGEALATGLKVNFKDGLCFDMAPYLILALMKDAFPPGLLQGGSITDDVAKVLKAVDLWDYMKFTKGPRTVRLITGDVVLDDGDLFKPDGNVMPFSLKHGGGVDAQNLAQSEQRDSKVANEFVRTLVEWVQQHNPAQEISEIMKQRIREMMTEMCDNALRHGAPETETGEWHTVGVLQKKADINGKENVICNLVILNLGKTIAETMGMAPADIREQVATYIDMHKDVYDPEVLTTLCALQDKISRIDPTISGNATLNGVGLMTTINNVFNPLFMSDVPHHQPSFNLISGKAWISARHPYNYPEGERGKRLLAFNENNDMNFPPDKTHVRSLSKSFPGTIISIRFVIGENALTNEDTKEP